MVSAKPVKEAPQAYYPTTSLKRCPEKLAEINLNLEEWNALPPETQQSLLSDQGREWIVEYFRCAIRHNTGADVYEESLERRRQALAAPKEEDE